ncbi:hypothetical protein SFHH103_psfHH103d_192 (plasmid) [Sinorhizobium fredii HH103]|uniref:Uncharacterized protein n=1 Tax=Sinorhizobium fredii (strain USDA 257) TaxID=1185652 RepID=I3XH79_SINF2|nr:hypothetical protein USDA257_p05200 [Sinorhizobium fredii USDA 257]CCE98923.1 hypothetical protein SFHH103_04446 [Sinorhizobium fredii HH103]CEO91389.1 hypothetical protein SFHH103_psfHH103d_192 [Sinorhizobium fredii HH103]
MTAPFPRDESLKNALAKRVVPHMSRCSLTKSDVCQSDVFAASVCGSRQLLNAV